MLPTGAGPDSSYQSTYDDNLVYQTQDGASAPLQPYEDQTPLDLRAPQTRQDISGAYPNNVQPVQGAPAQTYDRPIIIREDPLAVPSQPVLQAPANQGVVIERQGIESEQIYWDGR